MVITSIKAKNAEITVDLLSHVVLINSLNSLKEKQDLLAQIKDLEDEPVKVEKLEKDLVETKKLVVEKDSKIEQLEKKLIDEKKEINHSKKIKFQNTHLKQLIEEVETKNEQLEEANEKLTQKIAEQQVKLKKNDEHFEEILKVKEEEIDKLTAEIEELKSENNYLERQIEYKEKKNKQLASSTSAGGGLSLAAELNQANKSEEAEKKIAELEGKLEQKEKELLFKEKIHYEVLRVEAEKRKKLLSLAEIKFNNSQSNVSHLNQKLEKKDHRLQEIGQQNKILNNKLEERKNLLLAQVQAEVENNQIEIKKLKQKIDKQKKQAQKEKNAIQVAYDKIKKELSRSQIRENKQTKVIEKQENKQAEQGRTIITLNETINKIEAEKNKKASELEKLVEGGKITTSQLETELKAASKLETEAKKLGKENGEKEKEITKLKDRITNLASEIDLRPDTTIASYERLKNDKKQAEIDRDNYQRERDQRPDITSKDYAELQNLLKEEKEKVEKEIKTHNETKESLKSVKIDENLKKTRERILTLNNESNELKRKNKKTGEELKNQHQKNVGLEAQISRLENELNISQAKVNDLTTERNERPDITLTKYKELLDDKAKLEKRPTQEDYEELKKLFESEAEKTAELKTKLAELQDTHGKTEDELKLAEEKIITAETAQNLAEQLVKETSKKLTETEAKLAETKAVLNARPTAEQLDLLKTAKEKAEQEKFVAETVKTETERKLDLEAQAHSQTQKNNKDLNEKNRKLQSEIDSFKAELNEKTDDYDKLLATKSDLENEYRDLEKTGESLLAEFSEKEEQLAEARREKNKANSNIGKLEGEKNDLTHKLIIAEEEQKEARDNFDKLIAEKLVIKEELKQAKNQLATIPLETKLGELAQEKQQLEKKNKDLKKKINNQVREKTEKIAELEEQLKELQVTYQQEQEAREKSEQLVNERDNQNLEQQRQVNHFKQTIQRLENDIALMQQIATGEIDERQGTIANLENNLGRGQQENTNLQAQLRDSQAENSDNLERINDLEGTVENWEGQENDLLAQINNIQQERDARPNITNDEYIKIQDALDTAKEMINKENTNASELQSKVSQLEKEVNALASELKREKNNWNAEKVKLERKYKELEKKLGVTERKLAKQPNISQEDYDKLNQVSQAQAAQQQAEYLQAELKRTETEANDCLSSQIKNLRSELEDKENLHRQTQSNLDGLKTQLEQKEENVRDLTGKLTKERAKADRLNKQSLNEAQQTVKNTKVHLKVRSLNNLPALPQNTNGESISLKKLIGDFTQIQNQLTKLKKRPFQADYDSVKNERDLYLKQRDNYKNELDAHTCSIVGCQRTCCLADEELTVKKVISRIEELIRNPLDDNQKLRKKLARAKKTIELLQKQLAEKDPNYTAIQQAEYQKILCRKLGINVSLSTQEKIKKATTLEMIMQMRSNLIQDKLAKNGQELALITRQKEQEQIQER
ncbi:6709_t:CDS:10 [Entrophospora sp. SA101]|nr:6709_t:CDS:10 [Entrophospora sp. SA101]